MEKYFCISQSGISGITRVLTLTTVKGDCRGDLGGGGGGGGGKKKKKGADIVLF